MYTDPFGLTVTCTYNQLTGRMRCTDDSTGEVVVNVGGHSGGNEGKCPCVNDPRSQGVTGGAIPTGTWLIGQGYTWRRPGKKPLFDTMRLTPTLFTSLDGLRRSPGFLIHGGYGGGRLDDSNGCIILDPVNRHKIAQSGGGILHVVSGLAPFLPSFPLFAPISRPTPVPPILPIGPF